MRGPTSSITVETDNGLETYYTGEKVYDSLTGEDCIILDLQEDEDGDIGIFLDNDYLNGVRNPEEIVKRD